MPYMTIQQSFLVLWNFLKNTIYLHDYFIFFPEILLVGHMCQLCRLFLPLYHFMIYTNVHVFPLIQDLILNSDGCLEPQTMCENTSSEIFFVVKNRFCDMEEGSSNFSLPNCCPGVVGSCSLVLNAYQPFYINVQFWMLGHWRMCKWNI